MRRVNHAVRRHDHLAPVVFDDQDQDVAAHVDAAVHKDFEYGRLVLVCQLRQLGRSRHHADRNHTADGRIQVGLARPGLGAQCLCPGLHEQYGTSQDLVCVCVCACVRACVRA